MKDPQSRWRTAGILTIPDARRFVGRLSSYGIGYATNVDGRFIRVSVAVDDLQQAMELRPDTEKPVAPPRKDSAHYHRCVRLLVTLPLGAFLTTLVCVCLDIESRIAPSYGALALSFLVELFAEGQNERPGTRD